MPDPVGSTTWHHRHAAVLKSLGELIAREPIAARPIVLIVGPGAVTRITAGLLNDASRSDRSRLRKLIGDLARYADQLLRRIPALPLRSLEPIEVRAALGPGASIVVADRSRRVLDAVRRDLPDAECHQVDICRAPLPIQADIVIAFNVVGRLENPAAGMHHLVNAVKPGGLLLIDDRAAGVHLAACGRFRELAPKIHRRVDSILA